MRFCVGLLYFIIAIVNVAPLSHLGFASDGVQIHSERVKLKTPNGEAD